MKTKKKLLVVVGAGASLDFGMPSTNNIDQLFSQWASKNFSIHNTDGQNLYTWVKFHLTEFALKNKNNRLERIVNFETLLYTIQLLSVNLNGRHDNRFRSFLSPFINSIETPLIDFFNRNKETADESHFRSLQSSLIDQLLNHFRQLCLDVPSKSLEKIGNLESFFSALENDFDLGFINLNYDNIIQNAKPELNTGFNKKGHFERNLLYNNKWNFCYHLHGSVHLDFDNENNGEFHSLIWRHDLKSKFSSNSSGRSSNNSSAGIQHINSAIIAGLDKTNQILNTPFSQYFKQLDKVIYESDAILFIGYGFTDNHINRAFPFIRHDSKLRKVVIIDYKNNIDVGLSARHDGFSYGVFNTLPYNMNQMKSPISRMNEAIGHFKRNKILETSVNPNLPLALWYDGLISACNHPSRILENLI